MKRRISMIVLITICAALFATAGALAGPNDVVKVGLGWDPTTMNMLQVTFLSALDLELLAEVLHTMVADSLVADELRVSGDVDARALQSERPGLSGGLPMSRMGMRRPGRGMRSSPRRPRRI